MDNERHAIETAPKGYALAFNGEPIKKSCETCNHFEQEQEYSYRYFHCHHDERLENLKGFPFKSGCKHFELHWTYSVDWDAEARHMDEEREICEHLSSGYCHKAFNPDCEDAIPVMGGGHCACEKAL